MAEFSYTLDKDFDYTIDEKGNSFIALRKIKWGSSDEYRLDLRKWFNTATGETMSKGVSFMTDDGPHELVKVMVEQGYGHTKDIVEALKLRDDFDEDELPKVKEMKEKYYDPVESLFDDLKED